MQGEGGFFFIGGDKYFVFGNLDCGPLRSSGLSGTRCFSGGLFLETF